MTSQDRDWSIDADTANAAVRAAFDVAPVGLLVIDPSGMVISVNRRFKEIACPSDSATPPLHLSDFAIKLEVPTVPVEVELGSVGRMVWTVGANGTWVGAVTEGHASQVRQPARSDALTGLGDRQVLPDRYDALQARGGVRVLYLDLDRFKRVNDTLGHVIGDALLQAVAHRMQRVLQQADMVARVGGDEFVALIAGPVDDDEVQRIALSVVEKLSRPFLINGTQIQIGASIGLAKGNDVGFEEGLRHADVALYESKRLGRGCVTWFTPEMMTALEQRHELENALRRSLLLQELLVYFQPQYSFGSRQITGFEALLRWQRPDGFVQPSHFIPIAEDIGLMAKIGTYVLDAACRNASQWTRPLAVAVNVSPQQFMDDDFVATVKNCLKRWGLPPSRLELELTETLLVNDDRIVEGRMQLLRDIGVGLALDDFGTGYASLSYLRKFPFTKIKIDQSFVREPLADESARKIAAAVASLGSELGIDVIAEGVETRAQFERLLAQGVAAIQGYYLSEPIPGDGISGFVTKWGQNQPFGEVCGDDGITG